MMTLIDNEPMAPFLDELADQYDVGALLKAFRTQALHSIASPGFDWQSCPLVGIRAQMGTPALLVPYGASLDAPAMIIIKGEPYDCTLSEACGVALWVAMSKLNRAHGGLVVGLSLLAQYFVETRSRAFFDITDQA
jgi:hypothetical protein